MTNSVKNIKAGTIIVLSDLQSNKTLDAFVQSTYPGLTTMGLFQPKFKSFTCTIIYPVTSLVFRTRQKQAK